MFVFLMLFNLGSILAHFGVEIAHFGLYTANPAPKIPPKTAHTGGSQPQNRPKMTTPRAHPATLGQALIWTPKSPSNPSQNGPIWVPPGCAIPSVRPIFGPVTNGPPRHLIRANVEVSFKPYVGRQRHFRSMIASVYRTKSPSGPWFCDDAPTRTEAPRNRATPRVQGRSSYR